MNLKKRKCRNLSCQSYHVVQCPLKVKQLYINTNDQAQYNLIFLLNHLTVDDVYICLFI